MSWGKTKIEHHYTVVEVEKKPLQETPESVAAVKSLEDHAGFRWLLNKLKFQAARLESEFKNTRHKDLREVDFLQSGIHWCGWLQQQLDLTNEKYRQMRPATPQEVAHFQDIESTIELIGSQSQVD